MSGRDPHLAEILRKLLTGGKYRLQGMKFAVQADTQLTEDEFDALYDELDAIEGEDEGTFGLAT